MCGIAGIVHFNNDSVTKAELQNMTDVIAHRGPDGEGHWINESGSVGFGHRRLSIIDLSDNGKQPMHYLQGRYTITYNGEIYNYIEIKEKLVQKGYQFMSSTDTEVLLALYHLKGEQCLDDLDGMFAFAIWDEVEQSLFCARDRFGEKPFHYFYDGTRFVFASEIKQFWPIGIDKKIDHERLLKFTYTGIVDDADNLTSTYYENIRQLDAANYIKIGRDKELIIKRYWDINLDAERFAGTLDEAAEQFLELFTHSIKLRLRSDVPVGSSLSGGLDSSSIVVLIDELKGKEAEQNTFSARFKDFAKDEGKHIEAVIANCRNIQVHYTWPDKDYFQKVFDDVSYYQDEPYGSASMVAQYAVMQLAKEHNVTVLLDGQGADEQLGGYLFFYQAYLHQLFTSDRKLYRSELKHYDNYHRDALPYVPLESSETFRMKAGRYKRKLLNQEMPYSNELNKRLKYSTLVVGLKELLRYGDRNSMAHSREVRLPFLNHQLVEFIFSLPNEYKLNKGWTKYILRYAMKDKLPDSICWRTDKIGYEPPQKSWIKTDYFNSEIERAAKILDIPRKKENVNHVFTQDWRLLMASKFV